MSRPDNISQHTSNKGTCAGCHKTFTITTLREYGFNKCHKCFVEHCKNNNPVIEIGIEVEDPELRKKKLKGKVWMIIDQYTKFSKEDQNDIWRKNYPKSIYASCAKCDDIIDAFSFQIDYVNEKLYPVCKYCVHKVYHIKKDPYNKPVWLKHFKNGEISGVCPIRGNHTITVFNFEKGHIQSRAKNGIKVVDNLYPICRSCNNDMKDTNMADYYVNLNKPN